MPNSVGQISKMLQCFCAPANIYQKMIKYIPIGSLTANAVYTLLLCQVLNLAWVCVAVAESGIIFYVAF